MQLRNKPSGMIVQTRLYASAWLKTD